MAQPDHANKSVKHARVEAAASVREAAEIVSAEDTENISENAKECTADKYTDAEK